SPSKTSTSVNLSWNASTAGANCTIAYQVLQNGTQVASVSGTSTTISGLTANTTYSFTVRAADAAGTSAQSAALSVTTNAATCSVIPSVPSGLASPSKTSTS